MRKIVLAFFVVLCVSTLSSCSKGERKGESNKENIIKEGTEEENPFDLEQIEASGQNVEASYGFTISNMDNHKRVLEFDGKEVIAEIEFDNVGPSCEVGILVFIDGIVQKYYTSKHKEATELIPVRLEAESKSSMPIYFTPVLGQDGSKHKVFISCIYEPSYVASAKHIGYGNYQNMSMLLPWTLACEKKELETRISNSFTLTDITDEIKKSYIRKNSDGTVINKLDLGINYQFAKNDEVFRDSIKVENNKAEFDVQFFGGEEKTYRISAFANHTIVNAFDDKPYLDIKVEKDKMSTAKISFDSSELDLQDYSSLYICYVPLDSDTSEESALLDKTETISLVK